MFSFDEKICRYYILLNVIEPVVFSFTTLYLKLSSYKVITKTNHRRKVLDRGRKDIPRLFGVN